MKIGVIGTGEVGRVLAAGLASVGHEVKMGSRTPESATVKEWLANTKGAVSAGNLAETAKFGELIVLATNWAGTENALNLADPKNLADKVLMDVTNPLVMASDGPPSLALGQTDSGGEQVQRWAPDAKVVKTLNIVGNPSMVKPKFDNGVLTMYLCGNDAGAKSTTKGLLEQLGWQDIIDIGALDGARQMEAMSILWVKTAMAVGNWNIGFSVLRQPE